MAERKVGRNSAAYSAVWGLAISFGAIREYTIAPYAGYDRGKEMAEHKALTERTGVSVYFADPHSPWQRGSNENRRSFILSGNQHSLMVI